MREIKFSVPNITKQDINLVGKIIKSGWLTHGKYTSLFENEVKKIHEIQICSDSFELYSRTTYILHGIRF